MRKAEVLGHEEVYRGFYRLERVTLRPRFLQDLTRAEARSYNGPAGSKQRRRY